MNAEEAHTVYGWEDVTHPQKSIRLQEALGDYVDYGWRFPKEGEALGDFIINLMQERAKMRADNGVVRVVSVERENLVRLKENLNTMFGVESKINSAVNGIGTHYYQLSIYKRSEVRKAVERNLLGKAEGEKWSKLIG